MNSTLRAKLMARLMKNAKGFTLIELLVVIVIVGVLSAVAVPTFLNQVRRSRVAEAQAGLDVFGTAAEVFRFDNGAYPTVVGDIENSYVDGVWADTSTNYNLAVANGAAGGVNFTATGIGAAYEASPGTALSCVLGLGADSALTNIDANDATPRACNLP